MPADFVIPDGRIRLIQLSLGVLLLVSQFCLLGVYELISLLSMMHGTTNIKFINYKRQLISKSYRRGCKFILYYSHTKTSILEKTVPNDTVLHEALIGLYRVHVLTLSSKHEHIHFAERSNLLHFSEW